MHTHTHTHTCLHACILKYIYDPSSTHTQNNEHALVCMCAAIINSNLHYHDCVYILANVNTVDDNRTLYTHRNKR